MKSFNHPELNIRLYVFSGVEGKVVSSAVSEKCLPSLPHEHCVFACPFPAAATSPPNKRPPPLRKSPPTALTEAARDLGRSCDAAVMTASGLHNLQMFIRTSNVVSREMNVAKVYYFVS